MKCIICNSEMSFFFEKNFNEYGLKTVEYHKCVSCGFVGSKTHSEMSSGEWELLNISWHDDNNRRRDNPWNRNQRYFNQSFMLYLLQHHGVISADKWLDWGSGKGSLSKQLDTHFGLRLNNFDAFIRPDIYAIEHSELIKRGHNLVVNSAVFEHVLSRDTLDEIDSFVSNPGALAVHTLVCENIPSDPDWMYLLPVHCAFHCNRSMQVLMDQWGYTSSVYNPTAKLWVLFKENKDLIERKISSINSKTGFEYFIFKAGFVDYWK